MHSRLMMACMHRYMWGQASVDSGGLVDMDSYGRWSGLRGLLDRVWYPGGRGD